MFNAIFLLIVSVQVLVPVLAQDCWTTGCQPNNWAVKGCDQYDRDERGKQGCTDNNGNAGYKYTCCQRESGGGGGGAFVSFEKFSKAVTDNGYSAPSRSQYDNFNKHARTIGKISTVEEAAMALAQFLHESCGLMCRKEIRCARNNCQGEYTNHGCERNGQYYFGRGYVQLTWCYNYEEASRALFRDDRLLADPEQVARNDDIAWQTTFWYWGNKVHNAQGVQQGQFGASTRAINGRLECDQSHSGPSCRFNLYGRVRAAWGLSGRGDSSGCPITQQCQYNGGPQYYCQENCPNA